MIKNNDIICISSIDWDFIWQGHQEIMSTLASAGNRVLFIENTGVRTPNFKDLPRLRKRIYNWLHSVKGIRKERENLYILSPIVLPFPYSRIARWINKRLLMGAMQRWINNIGFSNPIVWTFLPTGLAVDIIDAIDSKLVVYYCIDNFSASSHQARKIVASENRLLAKADLVFVTSKSLYDRCSKFAKNVSIFPYGVNMDVYAKALDGKVEPPNDIASVRRPIIGYVGGIHKWIDFALVKYLAAKDLGRSFVFVGPLQREIDDFNGMPNVHFLGQKNYDQLPAYVSQFDVCLIPYLLTEYTKNVYPTKINEYLALGKPVVSTAIPEVKAYNERNGEIVSIAGSNEDFSSQVDKAIAERSDQNVRRKRLEVAAREGSWKLKIEKMSALIEAKIAEKELERALQWKDGLRRLYRSSTRKIFPVLAALLVAYAIVFYTPLVWFAAKPLVVSQTPVQADCVVVFGGGVGESGKAAQGYEERVGYAVELYKKGYAKHLILSSGYRYFFEETLLMKALAMALGVPEDAIVLENGSRNTYENVTFTKAILDQRRWKSALLVSSPYHMRRVSLVFDKSAKGVSVTCVPLPKSSFYSHQAAGFFKRQVNLAQIGAILHEYLGMAYYWWKGWI